MKKLLVPTDGSEFSKRAMEKAAEIAKAFDATVVVVNVNDLRVPRYSGNTGSLADIGGAYFKLIEESTENTKKILDEAYNYFSNLNIKVEQHELDGDPGNRIAQYAEENNDIYMIIMGSQGIDSGIQKFLLGSVTNKVLNRTDKPILIIK
ncbi:universal stress protein [Alkalibacter mobilis]|uniref:universal stress protein n=1 Tax=Alkalibacter mobilis TaxID=2787712 RepID=UPI0018A12343|nr:universal stress protein [Alkalibacter mobilis]MBF7097616.1 universal stress protein [Alkalibacter mobilis]